ncbi:hypothetical protein [Vibrio porteresiae]|uniref:Uncharacterized protein n=1 Tax=Vibrio porteresiae DSM 19223 TaxID=1123496 RepID=A0ABZ0QAB2_9VIBR|nr:hypothetical protein [Vibrio porteresiae]WPC72936.1 hypothetical protein R8Z52_12455 [Vibrio porteresiae DSM 19223]
MADQDLAASKASQQQMLINEVNRLAQRVQDKAGVTVKSISFQSMTIQSGDQTSNKVQISSIEFE